MYDNKLIYTKMTVEHPNCKSTECPFMPIFFFYLMIFNYYKICNYTNSNMYYFELNTYSYFLF